MVARRRPAHLHARQHPLEATVRHTLRRSGLRGAFNPSIAVTVDRTLLCSIRVPDDRAHSSTWLLSIDPDRHRGTVVENLSLRNRRAVGVATNDARLLRLDDGLYATFNTGHPPSRRTSNAVLVQRITPEVGDPVPVQILPRRRVEKNLMFEMLDGAVASTYEWDARPHRVVQRSDHWTVGPDGSTLPHDAGPRRINRGQGTPWIPWGSARVSVIHEKPRLGPLRSYRGRIAVRAPDDTVTLGASLLHSPVARLGSVRRRNPRLLHCTYFAGLMVLDGSLIASYGVNDRGFGIAAIDDLL